MKMKAHYCVFEIPVFETLQVCEPVFVCLTMEEAIAYTAEEYGELGVFHQRVYIESVDGDGVVLRVYGPEEIRDLMRKAVRE